MAAQELAYSPVPGKIDDVDEITALKIALIENDARSDPNPFEKARGTLQLLSLVLNKSPEEVSRLLIAMFNEDNRDRGSNFDNNVIVSSEEQQLAINVFKEMGTSWKSFVANQLPLFKLP